MNYLSILWLVVGHVLYAVFLLMLLRLTRRAYLAFRNRRNGFGVVFNAANGDPIPLVSIRLRNLHGAIVRTVVSDKEGRFRLLVPRGEYRLDVSKAGFHFPPSHTGNGHAFGFYDNLLTVPHIIVKDYGAIIRNIPMEPIDAQKRTLLPKKRLLLNLRSQALIGLLGPVAAFVIALAQFQSLLIWGLFALYVASLIDRLVSFQKPQPPFGTVRDAITEKPVERAVVRLFDRRYNKLIETEITSPRGRYAFLVNKGSYHLLIQKPGYKSIRLNYPDVSRNATLLATDVRLTPSASA